MATSAKLNVALNSNQRLEKSSSAYGNQPPQPQVGLGGLRGWHLPRQACSRHSAGSVSPPHTATPCECSDTTPPAPWHTPSATGQGLPQLPERENRINLSSCVLEWFPLQSEHGNTIQYSHLFINVFKHISIQQFLTCPKLWLESQRKKKLEKPQQLNFPHEVPKSQHLSSPFPHHPPLVKKKKIKNPKIQNLTLLSTQELPDDLKQKNCSLQKSTPQLIPKATTSLFSCPTVTSTLNQLVIAVCIPPPTWTILFSHSKWESEDRN